MQNHDNLFTRILKSRLFPDMLRYATAGMFLPILLGLLFGPADSSNPFNLLVWLTWWPLICLLFLVAGRIWCGICPFSLLGELAQRFSGLGLAPPEFLRRHGEWLIFISLFLLFWLEEMTGAFYSPRHTAIILLAILSGAVFFGLFFRGHAWCRYVCPLGGISMVYQRLSFFKMRPNEEICAECQTKDCVVTDSNYHGCPMYLVPFAVDASSECKLCGACLKRCPNGSIQLRFEPPTGELTGHRSPVTSPLVWLVVFMGGLIGFFHAMNSPMLPFAKFLHQTENPVLFRTLLMAAAVVTMYQLFRMLSALAAKWAPAIADSRIMVLFILPMIPLLLLTHLGYFSAKLIQNGGRLPGVVLSPDLSLLLWATPALILLGFLITLFISRKALMHLPAETGAIRLQPLFGLFYLLFAAANLLFAWPPAGMEGVAVIHKHISSPPNSWSIIWSFVGMHVALFALAMIVRKVEDPDARQIADEGFSATQAWSIRDDLQFRHSDILGWLVGQAGVGQMEILPVVALANACQEVIQFLQRSRPEGCAITVKAHLRKGRGIITIAHDGRPVNLPDYQAPTLESLDDDELEGLELRLAAAQVEHFSYQARFSGERCSFTLRQRC